MEKEFKTEYNKAKKELKKTYREKKRDARLDFKKEKLSAKTQYAKAREDYLVSLGKPLPKNPPKRSLLEEIGNAVTHGTGALFAIIAIILMLVHVSGAEELIGALIYSFGLFVMFLISCLYHAFPYGSAVKRLFRRFDYSSIYLLIGATFAPILLAYIGGTKGIVFFVIQWVIIALGVSLVGVFGPARLRFLHVPLYLILGWSGLLLVPEMLSRDPGFFAYIIGGGIIYSLGVIPFAIKAKVSHFIWHFFVLLGAVVQWLGIYIYIFLR
jgi:hemolysin III